MKSQETVMNIILYERQRGKVWREKCRESLVKVKMNA